LTANGDNFSQTDNTVFEPEEQPVVLNEMFSNWSVVQADCVGSGSKLTGVTALELVDESELAALRDGDSILGVCTVHFEGVTVSKNVNIV